MDFLKEEEGGIWRTWKKEVMGEDEHLRVSDGVWAGMERDVFPRAWD